MVSNVDFPNGVLISVVVPCRNESENIVTLLGNIESQMGLNGSYEVIIADGMSTDGTRDLISEYIADKSNMFLLDNINLITPSGLNLAIERAKGHYIARMDVHSEYAPDYLAQCLKLSLATGAANVGGAARTKAVGWRARAIAAAYGSPFAVGNAKFHFPNYEGPVGTVPYGFWKKETLIEIGMFDESLVRNQDDELNFRSIKMGFKIWQGVNIVSWYKPRKSFKMLFKQYFQYGYWKTVVIAKHKSTASWRHLIPASFLGSIFFLGVGGFFFPFIHEILIFQLAAYLVFLTAGAISISKTNGWDLFPILPLVIGVFHFGYGAGFFLGLLGIIFRNNAKPNSLSR